MLWVKNPLRLMFVSFPGFEEQVPAPEFGDDGLSAGKLPGKQQHVLIFDIHSNTFVCLPHQLAFAHSSNTVLH